MLTQRQLLDALETAGSSFSSVAASCRVRRDVASLREAVQADIDERRRLGVPGITYSPAPADGEAVTEETVSIWREAGSLRLQIQGGPRDGYVVIVAGRGAVRAYAWPRPYEERERTLELHPLGEGANEYLLDVDVGRGVLLRCQALRDGRLLQDIEALSVQFDAAGDSGLFQLDHMPGSN